MQYFKHFNIRELSIPKIVGILVVGLIGVAVVLSILKTALQNSRLSYNGSGESAPYVQSYREGFTSDKGLFAPSAQVTAEFSYPYPVPPIMPPNGQYPSPGNDAENFEVTSYTASVEASDSTPACSAIEALKPKEYVIFESSNTYDDGCSYQFKVEKSYTDEILEFVNALDPKTLARSVYTIKRAIEYHTNEIEILEKKIAAVEEILNRALEEYNEIGSIAKSEGDAESLAKIIDSKVQLIERLTNERLNVLNQVNTLNRSHAENLDRLAYTVFSVSVFENKLIDLESIGDSWIEKIQVFVFELNMTLQQLTLAFIGFLFKILVYVLYAAVILFIAKYGWRALQQFWKS